MPCPDVCVPWEADMACCEEWADYAPEVQCRALGLAWSTLRLLTAGRVGRCPVVMRPCLTPACDACSVSWTPAIVAGDWYNIVCGTPKCSCARLCEIVMPGEIATVDSVMLDGITLDTSLFRVDNGNRLVRQDGLCWPSCQAMDRPLGEYCTLGITYTPGVVPDSSGLWAAGVLACEYAKACTGGKCRLPSSVTSISRQGVTMTMSEGLFAGGVTGIREVDAYIKVLNPHGHWSPSFVWSPDVPWEGHRYQTWPPIEPLVVP